MVGAITQWDILAHPFLTIDAFGWLVFFKAVCVGQGRTFLSMLAPAISRAETESDLSSLIEQAIRLELQAKRIYTTLADEFADRPAIRRFFENLAGQEQEHADLLALCREAARHGRWRATDWKPWQEYLPRLERRMRDVEASLHQIQLLDDALRLVIEIESSEVNSIFRSVVAACDSSFVRKLAPFQRAMESHFSYIIEELPILEPRMTLALRELRVSLPVISAN
jgi:hypothetical protein